MTINFKKHANFSFIRKSLFAHKKTWAVFAILLITALLLDFCFPLPKPGRDSPYAMVVLARDGTPLRAFPDKDHIWRHAISLQ